MYFLQRKSLFIIFKKKIVWEKKIQKRVSLLIKYSLVYTFFLSYDMAKENDLNKMSCEYRNRSVVNYLKYFQ